MAWTYHQFSGRLEHDGRVIATGYSGYGLRGENNPLWQTFQGYGPIPRGLYRISLPYHHPTHGVFTMNLTPVGHHALGRTGFQIHGDSKTKTYLGMASEGCIILALPVRERIGLSADKTLAVGW